MGLASLRPELAERQTSRVVKVAMVSPYDLGEVGGVQNQVFLLAEEMSGRGHEVTIVGPGRPTRRSDFVSLGPSRVVLANESAAPISIRPAVVGRLRRAVAGSDVVHVHEPLMPLVGIAARWTGKPLVGTFHADPSRLVRTLYRWFPPLRWHVRAYAALTAVSETARSAVESFGGVSVVPNGVVTGGLPEREPVSGRVVFVGRDDPRKGLGVAVAAMEILRRTMPDAELVVVTPDDVVPRPGIVVRRGVDDAEKWAALASAAVFVAPNLGGESFGLVVAEAMAAGCPTVVSDLPAFRAVVGDAGVCTPPGDPVALAAALGELLQDDRRLGEMSAGARRRAAAFSIEGTADRYEAIYRMAVSDRPELGDPT